MKGLVASRSLILLLAGVVTLGTLALSGAPPAQAPSQTSMELWEAAARGFVSVVMENETFTLNGNTETLPVGIRVTNAASVPVVIPEEAVLMSPHPSVSPPPNPLDTTADAVLTDATVPAGGSVLFSFGEYVLAGYLTGPAWWDVEEMQFSKAGVAFHVGGETLPFALRSLVEHPFYHSPSDNTQTALWAYLRSVPTVVVGKEPLWSTIGGAAGATLHVRLDTTNLAIWATDDTATANVNVTNGILEDTVPAGWSVEEGSFSVPPDRTVANADGSQTLAWNVTLPAAEVSDQGNPNLPTDFTTVSRFYTLVSPALGDGSATLPRALSDMNRTGTPDAQSAPVIVTGNLPPVADAGGPYTGVEGTPITLDASKSSDPNGDPLEYRWSFTDNGVWDTAWSASPTASVTYTDEFSGNVRVEVTDGHFVANATASVTVLNVPPTIRSLTATNETVLDFHLTLAGEKWHDARFVLGANGTEDFATLRVTRQPGDPKAQAEGTGMLILNSRKPITATVTYSPADDKVNGQPNGDTPAWLLVTLSNGTALRFFHNFNVKHEATWTWSLGDLREHLPLGNVTLVADLFDPGSDALTVHWDFGDGTNLTQVFPAGAGGDAAETPIGGPAPVEVIASVAHTFPTNKSYTVTLTVTDADGASTSATLTIPGS